MNRIFKKKSIQNNNNNNNNINKEYENIMFNFWINSNIEYDELVNKNTEFDEEKIYVNISYDIWKCMDYFTEYDITLQQIQNKIKKNSVIKDYITHIYTIIKKISIFNNSILSKI